MTKMQRCVAETNVVRNGNARCLNKSTRDGYCAVHHPDTVKTRKVKREAQWKEQDKQIAKTLTLERAAPEMFALLMEYDNLYHEAIWAEWKELRNKLLDRIRKELGE